MIRDTLFFVLLFVLLSTSSFSITSDISDACVFKGKKLYGKVKFVTAFPDFKVKVVKWSPNLKVKLVTSFPNHCGEWQVNNLFPDFKVQIVDTFPDFTIQFVDNLYGLP